MTQQENPHLTDRVTELIKDKGYRFSVVDFNSSPLSQEQVKMWVIKYEKGIGNYPLFLFKHEPRGNQSSVQESALQESNDPLDSELVNAIGYALEKRNYDGFQNLRKFRLKGRQILEE